MVSFLFVLHSRGAIFVWIVLKYLTISLPLQISWKIHFCAWVSMMMKYIYHYYYNYYYYQKVIRYCCLLSRVWWIFFNHIYSIWLWHSPLFANTSATRNYAIYRVKKGMALPVKTLIQIILAYRRRFWLNLILKKFHAPPPFPFFSFLFSIWEQTSSWHNHFIVESDHELSRILIPFWFIHFQYYWIMCRTIQ